MQAKGILSGKHGKMVVMPGMGAHPIPKSPFNTRGVSSALPNNGLIAWFDPSKNITLNGSTVSAWADTTGAITLSQATSGAQPSYVSNPTIYGGFPYLQFDGSNDQLTASNVLGIGSLTQYTIILVGRYVTNVTNARLATFALGSTGEYRIAENTSGISYRHTFNNGSGAQLATYAPIDTAMHIHALQINRVSNRIVAQYDGNAAAASNNITAGTTDYSTGTFILGGAGGQRQVLDMLFYNRALSSAEYTSLYNHFKNKYQL
jgi:hypothetical protein